MRSFRSYFIVLLFLAGPLWARAADRAFLLLNSDAPQARMDLIANSKQPFMSVFEMMEDDVSLAHMDALIRSAQHGGRPRLLLDALGHKISPDLIDYLIEEGVDVRFFRPIYLRPVVQFNLGEALQRMHDKIITNESNYAIMGGRNAEESYFWLGKGENNCIDYDVFIQGQTGRAARTYQEALWNSPMVEKPLRLPLSNRLRAQFTKAIHSAVSSLRERGALHVAPTNWDAKFQPVDFAEFVQDRVVHTAKVSGAETALIKILRSAKKEILIDAQYLLLTPDLAVEFKNAVNRGVNIEIITNGKGATAIEADATMRKAFEMAKPFLRKLRVSVYEFPGPGKIHSKAIVADREDCLIWSFNIDARSRYINYESGAHVQSKALCGELADSIHGHMDHSPLTIDHGRQLTPDEPVSSFDRLWINTITGEL